MNKSKYNWIWVIFMVAVPFAYAAFEFNRLPLSIPMHFNIKGEADAWGSKENIFLLPVIMGLVSVIIYLLLSNLKSIDPKRYAQLDKGEFKQFGLFSVLFLTLISLTITFASAHENTISINRLIFPILGIGFTALGIYMPKISQNYFVGLRLPWTLESKENWEATHAFGGKIWIGGGISVFLTSIFIGPEIFGIIFLVIIAMMVLIPIVYSYWYYRKSI